ncbi:MAG TPA: hypothetical protein VEX43_09680 [Chthoniobacterales bacterium]|nr:hypothetical protein [Chthoniobacterales bacterium]
MRERIEKLKQAIEQTERCRAEHVESRVILEGFAEAPIWEGVVETFQLHNHPSAKRAYAWLRGVAHSPLEKPEDEYTIVLGIPPVISPETAVKAAVMAICKDRRKQTGIPQESW